MNGAAPVFVALTPAGLAIAERAQAALGGDVHALAGVVSVPPLSLATGEGDHAKHGGGGAPTRRAVAFTDTAAHLRALFQAGRPIVGICATGILVRILSPLLADKRAEPPVLALSEDGSSVVPLIGGHRGANDLARALAAALAGHAAITTAGDGRFGVPLDAPPHGWTLANPEDAKPVMAALLAGAAARIEGDLPWLDESALPRAEDGAVRIVATTRAIAGDSRTLVYHPRRLAVGIGSERGADPAEAIALLRDTLAEAGLAPAAVACVVSIDLKADEPAVLEAAEALGAPARFFPAARLEAETPRLANPSEAVFREIGCHGVAEAAALAAAGPQAALVVAKRKSRRVTCAIAEAPAVIDPAQVGRARGRLAIVGIGPGAPDWLTPEAEALLRETDAAVGYSLYLDLVAPLIAVAERFDSALGSEEARARQALALAAEGRAVALISSGDAGIYAMATLVFELLDRPQGSQGSGPEAPLASPLRGGRAPPQAASGWGATTAPSSPPPGAATAALDLPSRGRLESDLDGRLEDPELPPAARRVEVLVAPGISALQAAAARAGAPLGHDFCAISLSDLLTPWEAIERRLRAAAEGDFVVALYNPVSQKRRWQLAAAKAILLAHRPPDTPVVLARNLGRAGESVRSLPLAALDPEEADMLTLVLVGASTTRQVTAAGRTWTYTPRGYERKRSPSPPLRGRDGEGEKRQAAALHLSALPVPPPQGGRG